MPDDPASANATTIRAATPVPFAGRHMALVVFFRDGLKVHPLPETGTVVVGRGAPADLQLEDPSLSRQHARFVCKGDEVWVEDLGSTNGTLINGRRKRRGRVNVGDAVGLGSVAVSLHVLSTAQTELHGVQSFEGFAAALDEEVLRAQTFARAVGVLLLQAAEPTAARLDRWCSNVRALLRPVDHLALYSPAALLVCLVESDVRRTAEVAQQIVLAHKGTKPAMLCGWSVYPDCAVSGQALIATVRAAAQQATCRDPVVGAPPVIMGGPAASVQSGRVVKSPRMHEVYRLAEHLAASPIPVLIYGETGVGKELVAQAIHTSGPRAHRPLCSINCGAIPQTLIESVLFGHERGAFTGAEQKSRGVFENAEHGTLLLDEIGELSPAAQVALLRVLDTKRFCRVGSSSEVEVDVRVIAATHRDLEEMVRAGSFRADLLFRLNTMVINVPPLRERPEEILPLAEHFVRRAAGKGGSKLRFDEVAIAAMQAYAWPGNVRELRNAVERAAVLALDDVIALDDLPDRIRRAVEDGPGALGQPQPRSDIRSALHQVEAQLLVNALEANGWNQSQTARALGMPRRTLVYKLRRYGIREKDAR